MRQQKEKFFISTALPYVNARPHIGFALEIIQADAIARWQRLLGKDVFFLTGTDENSLKNVKAAEKENIGVKDFVDRNAEKFFGLKKALNLTFDDFIRTTEERHKKGVYRLWQATKKDIYKKKYKGLYCLGCEEFYKEEELSNGLCPEHKTKPEIIEEENYFFRLSSYEARLKKIIESDEIEIIPSTRKNEILSFIDSGLEDICISRFAGRGKGWGIKVPDDSSQIFWVWYDALSNYITALGYAYKSERFKEFWQKNDNILHIIGKGILRFHAIYWPAMLLSAGLSLPKKIFVHGYITVNSQKMSKSLGNVIDPFELVERYGTDPVRYFLLREISATEDGDFTIQKFESRYNADLANGLGNLAARIIALVRRSKPSGFFSEITAEQKLLSDKKLKAKIIKTEKDYEKALDNFKFNEALASIWELMGFCDRYIEKTRPWEKSDNQLSVINDLLIVLGKIAGLLRPFLPQTSGKISDQIKTNKTEPLFPRILK